MLTARLRLPGALAAWTREGESPGFAAALKLELESLGSSGLPLAELSDTGYAADAPPSVDVLAVSTSGGQLRIVLGVQFEEALPGCSCGDEAEPRPAYGQLELLIDTCTGRASVAPLPEPRPG